MIHSEFFLESHADDDEVEMSERVIGKSFGDVSFRASEYENKFILIENTWISSGWDLTCRDVSQSGIFYGYCE